MVLRDDGIESDPSSVFGALIGQSRAIQLLSRAIACNRLAPAYLFVGPSGVGRTLAARYFLAQLMRNAGDRPQRRLSLENHPDVLWVEPTYLQNGKMIPVSAFAQGDAKKPKSRPQIRVDQVREVTRFIHQTPLEASRLVMVMDAAECMGEAAANGLLKTLEEPGNATLILLSTSTDALLPTIVSRCQKIPFSPLSELDMTQVLTRVGHQDILQIPPVMLLAQGSPGGAIAHWETLQTIDPELLSQCTQGPSADRHCLELAKHIDSALDLEQQQWLVDYLQQHFWYASGNVSIIQVLEQTKRCLRQYVQPLLTWEVTWLDIFALSYPIGS